MSQDNTPLDERVHQDHMQNLWYQGALPNSEFIFKFMDQNMLHHYFSQSPFFDWTTKNGLQIQQAQRDMYVWKWSHDRRQFEAAMAERGGEEYMIVEGEDMEFDAQGQPIKGGVWVIRKQDRHKAAGPKGADKVDTLATYFVVNENVYQAPSVADILGTRLLSASTALTKCFAQASTLSKWSPTTGHTYPVQNPSSSGKNATTPGGGSGSTPSRSREGSVSTDFRGGSVIPGGAGGSSAASEEARANQLLRASLAQSFTYAGDPFSDENPLQGEPGNFKLSESNAAVNKRKHEVEAAALAKEEALAAALAEAAAAASKPATPAASSPTDGKVKKPKEKKKRRKSKGGAQSPPMSPVGGMTPAGGTPAVTPGGPSAQ